MKKIISTLLILIASLLVGCMTTSSSIPEDYTGPRAMIIDSFETHSPSKADFFGLVAIDGKGIDNCRRRTGIENYGNGLSMSPITVRRDVPAAKAQFKLEGRTDYAAPIQALSNPVYEVVGVIEFAPREGFDYVVKGTLSKEYSAIWIEELVSGNIVGEKIEAKGNCSVGFLKK